MKTLLYLLLMMISYSLLAQTYELGINKEGQKFFISHTNDCEDFETKMNNIVTSFQHLYGVEELAHAHESISTSCQEKRGLLLSDLLPETIYKRIETSKKIAGPNCFNNVLKILNYTPFYGMVHSEDFKSLIKLNPASCKRYHGTVKGGLVGIISVKDNFNNIIDLEHAFYTVNKDMIYETLSPGSSDYILSPLTNYESGKQIYDREVTKISYYECTPKSKNYWKELLSQMNASPTIGGDILSMTNSMNDFLTLDQLESLSSKSKDLMISKIKKLESQAEYQSRKLLYGKIINQINNSR
jgi:hypothetical protein